MLQAPPELRNRMTRLDIEAQGGAGSTVLLDERNRRRPVAILGERAAANGQPLLQEVYFLERALDPYVSLTDRRSRDGADPQHRRAADPRRRLALAQRPRRDRQVDRARRRRRALRRPQPRRRRRYAGADAAAARRPRAGRRDELGPAERARRVPGQQPVPRHPGPQGRAHPAAGAGRADARPRRQDLGAAGRRHAAGHRREARPGLPGADPHHRQHRLEQHGAVGPVREHAAAAGDPVARRGGRRRQQGAEAVAHARRLRQAGRTAGGRADAAGRRRPDLQAQADDAAGLLRRRERAGRLQHRRPCRDTQAAGAAGRRRDRPAVRGRRDRSRALVPARRRDPAAARPAAVALAARADAARGAHRPRRTASALLLGLAVFAAAARHAGRKARRSASPPRPPTSPARRRSARSRRSRARSTCGSPTS